jgi:hypothetical protein
MQEEKLYLFKNWSTLQVGMLILIIWIYSRNLQDKHLDFKSGSSFSITLGTVCKSGIFFHHIVLKKSAYLWNYLW